MKKGTILGLSNTDDMLWYRLRADDLTLKLIDLVFDIYDNLFEEDARDIHAYAYQTGYGTKYFHKETKEVIVYFMLAKTEAHVLLRKTLRWKKFDSELKKMFEFKK